MSLGSYLTLPGARGTMACSGNSRLGDVKSLGTFMADAAKVFLAADLGASSGRVVAGIFDGAKLALEEVYRFDNGGVPLAGRMQ